MLLILGAEGFSRSQQLCAVEWMPPALCTSIAGFNSGLLLSCKSRLCRQPTQTARFSPARRAGDAFVRLLAERHHDDHSFRWDSSTGEAAPKATQIDSQLDFYWRTDMGGMAEVIDQL